MSHNGEDKPVVEEIGRFLEKKGFTVWIDKWCMTPGDSLIAKIGDAIDSSNKLIVFLSPSSVESNWVKLEIATGKLMELANERGIGEKFIIPVLLKHCRVPWFLREKIYVNFTDKSFDQACEEIIRGLTDKTADHSDEKLVNETITIYWSTRREDGKYSTLFEFGAMVSPISSMKMLVEISNNDVVSWDYWVNNKNTNTPPDVSKITGVRKNIGKQHIEIELMDTTITSMKSFYIRATTNSPLTEDDVGIQTSAEY
ncbi:toll/interleukin-1 receptor domain-containing protein [Klebsiella pneumoniae]|nr:toll/interleukin-1 receptor domain-containing protein [Klebsiella pneumoniae]